MYIGCCASARHGVAAVHYCHHAALRSTAAIHCGNVSLLGKTRKDQTRQTGRRDGGDGHHKSATLRRRRQPPAPPRSAAHTSPEPDPRASSACTRATLRRTLPRPALHTAVGLAGSCTTQPPSQHRHPRSGEQPRSPPAALRGPGRRGLRTAHRAPRINISVVRRRRGPEATRHTQGRSRQAGRQADTQAGRQRQPDRSPDLARDPALPPPQGPRWRVPAPVSAGYQSAGSQAAGTPRSRTVAATAVAGTARCRPPPQTTALLALPAAAACAHCRRRRGA
jgi:hypothetical protein